MTNTKGFSASLLQVRVAYENHFSAKIPSGMTYAEASQAIVDAIGMEAAKDLILSIPNDPNDPKSFSKLEKAC